MLLPFGMARHALWSLPRRELNSVKEACSREITFFSVCLIFWSFSGGSSMVRLIPSKIQPRISFRNAQIPSPSLSFLRDMGSSSGSAIGSGAAGKMEWIACRSAREWWRSTAGSVHWMALMKSSMYTSSSLLSWSRRSGRSQSFQVEGFCSWYRDSWSSNVIVRASKG